ncbi:hypothetical protein [Bradyrhizobium jicamae]|nr:hypothetical protein [Bradyrhizobium jicamae]
MLVEQLLEKVILGRGGIVAEGTNPARGIDSYKESRRERFLTAEELQ